MRTTRELLLLLPPLWSLLAVACSDPQPSELMPIVSRDEWKARSPLAKPDIQTMPLKLVIIHDTKTAECSTLDECAAVTREVQDDHMDNEGWNDIGYNFLVGGDGRVYEGRGWDHVGAHTLFWNRRSLGVALIGNFTAHTAPERQVAAALELIRVGGDLGKLHGHYRLTAACQLRPYDSPGQAQYDAVRGWDHWWQWSTADAYCRIGGKSKHKKVGSAPAAQL